MIPRVGGNYRTNIYLPRVTSPFPGSEAPGYNGYTVLFGPWRSLVARLTGGQEVVGSNPAGPTIGNRLQGRFLCVRERSRPTRTLHFLPQILRLLQTPGSVANGFVRLQPPI